MDKRVGRQAPRLVIQMIVALLASLASLLWLSERGYEQRSDLVRNTSQVRDRQMHASRLLIAVTEGESAMRGFLVGGDPSMREPLEEARRIHFGMSASGVASATPPLSRTASRIMKSPMAAGTRMPLAMVTAFSNFFAKRSPC